ncbi:MAG: Holliday junction resolvase RuvX [Cryobacterium sp.]|nr:Holliday junction resolvase RuvX [Cryobacterium sp.]MCO5293914.1 Holliday junction resolvase RuvX [Homoserinimonas sp.]MCW5944746.1 Holliday junction resolvase RuvX [Cryobacterium sp.]
MRQGIRLGIDVGKARVGISRSDSEGLLVLPLETLPRNESTLNRVLRLAEEYGAIELVVGLPLSLDGSQTPSTKDAQDFAAGLAASGTITVRLVDERLSTVHAQSRLRDAGKSTKNSRSVIDQVAATIILQNALEAERLTGSAPGRVLTDDDR